MPPNVIEPTGEARIGKEDEETVRLTSTSECGTNGENDDGNKIHVTLGAARLKKGGVGGGSGNGSMSRNFSFVSLRGRNLEVENTYSNMKIVLLRKWK